MAFRVSGLKKDLKGAWAPNKRLLLRNISAWLIFAAIIIVFVYQGIIPDQQGISNRGAAATVDHDLISVADFVERVEILNQDPRLAQLRGLGGDFFDRYVRSQAIQSLIDGKLVGKTAEANRLYVSDAMVRDVIQGIGAFNDQGRFSQSRYLSYLQSTGQEASEFESKVRSQLVGGQFARAFQAALAPVDLEKSVQAKIGTYAVTVEALTLSADALYTPEQVTALELAQFLAQSDAKARIKTYFEANKQEFEQPEQAKVRHILFKAKDNSEAELNAAKAKADAALAKLKGGAQFESLAQELSDDPGSKSQGGLIDFFPRGMMAPEFETYAFTGVIGELSQPIKTSFGYHVIRIEARKPKSEKTLAESEDQIGRKLASQDKSKTAMAKLEAALAAGDFATIDSFARDNNLTWKKSGPIRITDRTAAGIGGSDPVVAEAFRLSEQRKYSSALVNDGGQKFILKFVSSATVAPATEKLPDSDASRRGEVALSQFMQSIRSQSKISVNPTVVGEGQGI